MPGLLLSGLAGGGGQRVTLSLALQFGQADPSQGQHRGVLHHRVSSSAEPSLIPRMPLRQDGADRAIAQDPGL